MTYQSSPRDTPLSDSGAGGLTKGHSVDYDWEIPEISMQNAQALRLAFSRNDPLTPEILQAIFMKYIAYGRLLHHKVDIRDLILDLLSTGAQNGCEPLRALIYCVHEHFQVLPSSDVTDVKLLWMSEAVAGGAFFLRKSLQHLDSSLLENAIQRFHKQGGYNRFYAGLSREDLPKILERASLGRKANIDRKASLNGRGDKLLHLLASIPTSDGFEDILKLMDLPGVNALNDHGETALYRACMTGVTSNVLLLLSRGADPSITPSHHGPTCLHWLFHFNPEDIDTIAKELIMHGASVHSRSEQQIPTLYYPFTLPTGTPLHWAVEMSVAEATLALLRQGANPSTRDGRDPYAYDDNVRDLYMSLPPDTTHCSIAEHTTLGFSAIDVAVKNLDHKILEILLSDTSKYGLCDTDEEGYTALHRLDAGEWQHTSHGSAVWCPLFQGPTVARTDSLRKTVATLLRHHFEIDKMTNQKKFSKSSLGFSGQTPLMLAVTRGNTETMKILIDAGANVNVANDEGETALLSLTDDYATDEACQSNIVSLLLNANANIRARDSRGNTPFIRAATFRLHKLASVLLDHGADLRDRVMDTTSWQCGWLAIALLAKCRLDKAADHDEWLISQLNSRILPRLAQPESSDLRNELLEKADLDGGTLLHCTASEGLIRSCKILLEAGVSINSLRRREKFRRGGKVISYRTPLDEAQKNGKHRLKFQLRQFSEQGMSLPLNTMSNCTL